MGRDELQIEPGETEEEAYLQKPLPQADTEQELIDQLAYKSVIPSCRGEMKEATGIAECPRFRSRQVQFERTQKMTVSGNKDDDLGDDGIAKTNETRNRMVHLCFFLCGQQFGDADVTDDGPKRILHDYLADQEDGYGNEQADIDRVVLKQTAESVWSRKERNEK